MVAGVLADGSIMLLGILGIGVVVSSGCALVLAALALRATRRELLLPAVVAFAPYPRCPRCARGTLRASVSSLWHL